MFNTLLAGEVMATLGSILPFLLLIPIFYFLMYRPQKKQEREVALMRNSLLIGDEIVTIGGIIGKIVKVKDDYVIIESGPDRCKLKFRKTAIASVEKKAGEGTNQRSTFKVKTSEGKEKAADTKEKAADNKASYDPEV